MKRVYAIILAALLTLGMTACGGGETAPVKEMDMQELYVAIQEAVQMPEMLTLDESLMLDYCGIRAEQVKQAVVVICADSLRTDELWLLEAVDEAAAKTLSELANTRLRKKGEESITYSPEQYAVVEKAELLRLGNYVILLVSPDSAAMADVVKANQ